MRLRQNTTQCKELAILIFSLGLIIFLFLSMETYIYSILSAIKNNLLSIVSVGKKKEEEARFYIIYSTFPIVTRVQSSIFPNANFP